MSSTPSSKASCYTFESRMRLLASQVQQSFQWHIDTLSTRREQILKQLEHVMITYTRAIEQEEHGQHHGQQNNRALRHARRCELGTDFVSQALARIMFQPPDPALEKALSSMGVLLMPSFGPYCKATGDGLEYAVPGINTSFTIATKDCFNEDIPLGGEDVSVEIQAHLQTQSSCAPVRQSQIPHFVIDHNNGKYTVNYCLPRNVVPESFATLSVEINGLPMSSSPFRIKVQNPDKLPNWRHVLTFGDEGNDSGYFCRPWGVAITRYSDNPILMQQFQQNLHASPSHSQASNTTILQQLNPHYTPSTNDHDQQSATGDLAQLTQGSNFGNFPNNMSIFSCTLQQQVSSILNHNSNSFSVNNSVMMMTPPPSTGPPASALPSGSSSSGSELSPTAATQASASSRDDSNSEMYWNPILGSSARHLMTSGTGLGLGGLGGGSTRPSTINNTSGILGQNLINNLLGTSTSLVQNSADKANHGPDQFEKNQSHFEKLEKAKLENNTSMASSPTASSSSQSSSSATRSATSSGASTGTGTGTLSSLASSGAATTAPHGLINGRSNQFNSNHSTNIQFSNSSGNSSGNTSLAFIDMNSYQQQLQHIYLIGIADRSNNRIQLFKFDSIHANVTLVTTFGSGPGSRAGQFDRPAGIVFDNLLGHIIVADKDNHRVQVFDMTGQHLFKFGERGTKVGQFCYPWDIDVCRKTNNILVSDTRNRRIQIFDSMGHYLNHFSHPLDSPRGVAFLSPAKLIISDFNKHRLLMISTSDENDPISLDMPIVAPIPKHIGFGEGSSWGEFLRPQGVAYCGSNVYCSDSRNNRITCWNEETQTFTYIGNDVVDLDRPAGLAAIDDFLVIVDFGNNRVHICQH